MCAQSCRSGGLGDEPRLDLGVHQFWVKVDSTNAVDEVHETDNVGTGTVEVTMLVRYVLPLTFRLFTP